MTRKFDDSQGVEKKIYHPGQEAFLTEDEFQRALTIDRLAHAAEVEEAQQTLPQRRAERLQRKELAKEKRERFNFAGKTLWPNVKENPRKGRMGKTDWGSSDIILSHPGLTFERFIELGGRECDLRWDINPLRNWTIVKKGDAPPVQSTEVPVEEVPDVECTMCGEMKPHDKRWDSSTAGAEDRHLCSEKCWSEFMDWGVWQKDLGNGITNEFNGPSPRGGIYRNTPVAEGPLVDDKTGDRDTIPGQ